MSTYREAHLLSVAQHRHHQAVGRGHGHGDVHVVTVHDLVRGVVDHGVDGGDLQQGSGGGLVCAIIVLIVVVVISYWRG